MAPRTPGVKGTMMQATVTTDFKLSPSMPRRLAISLADDF